MILFRPPLRDYQKKGVEDGVHFLTSARPGERRMFCAPCGCGKSYVELGILEQLSDCVLITPRTEIIDGMVSKGGDLGRICTPVTFRNALLAGRLTPPKYLLVDEGHHDTSKTAEQIRLCLGDIPTLAFTATPYRGTPQGTAALQALYGEPHWLITLHDAASRGYVCVPECTTVPVLDDDIVEITNGELNVRRIDEATDWQLATDLVARHVGRSTVVSVSSVYACKLLRDQLEYRGITTDAITAESSKKERDNAFANVTAGRSILVQVNVVSEGVDLPFRVLVDLAPTLSPVKWLQQVGRVMRPGGGSEYICANRNLLRHGYLLEGHVPIAAMHQAQTAFPQASPRLGYRAFGLEGVGRLKPASVPLANGLKAQAYYVTERGKTVSDNYVAIILPNSADVLWAKQTRVHSTYSRWSRCEPPKKLSGFASVPPKPMSEKQLAWWKKEAEYRGLDSKAKVDAKTFGVLPVLSQLGVRIKC